MNAKDVVSRTVARFQHWKLGRPEYMIFFGSGIGDDLLCATVAHEWKKRGAGRIVISSRYPELFEQSSDVDGVYRYTLDTINRLRHWGYKGTVPQYSVYDKESDRDVFPQEHLLATMCRISGIFGEIDLRTYLTLLTSEKERGRLRDNQIAIQSGGLGNMRNKDWLPEYYQAVADQLCGKFDVIHLGQKADPPIHGALDLRGKTTLRESAAILASSLVFIGQVGFLMHLARAVDCRSVIIYGGREAPAISGYVANENVIGRTFCAPCWQRNKCDYGHECMRMIAPTDALAAVRRQLDRHGTPLEVDRVTLEPSRISTPIS